MKLSKDEIALLRSLVEWRRANGWTLERSDAGYVQWAGRDGWSVDVYLPGGAEMTVESATRRFGVWYPLTVTAAVDVLVAVGVAPPEFSSAFRAGRESAYTEDEWRVSNGGLMWGHFTDRTIAESELSDTSWLEHRRTGATGWEKVADADS